MQKPRAARASVARVLRRNETSGYAALAKSGASIEMRHSRTKVLSRRLIPTGRKLVGHLEDAWIGLNAQSGS
jgi:hypothetical protein